MTIDRLDANGAKAWASGVEVTGGGGSKGFSGNISMNTASNNDLYVTWDANNGDVLHAKVAGTGSLGWADPLSLSNLAYNSKRCYARIRGDSTYVTWLQTVNGVTSTMLQKIGPDGNYALPAGGKAVGIANDYYGYPEIAFGGNNAVAFFSTNNAVAVGIGAQGLKPDNSLLWAATRTVSNAYQKGNFYQDFVALDNATDCNTIFWTGFDGNIYGANTCKNAAVLAITTGSVKVETVGTRNKISWESYNEIAGSSYEVERSLDGSAFASLALIKARGTNSSYAFWDETAVEGTNFYRIKLNNASGRTEYSNVVKAVINSKKAVVLSAYPNPVKGLLTISLNTTPGRNNGLSIYDMTGKVVKSFAIRSVPFTIDMIHFLPGVYLIKYKDDNQQAVIKIRKE
ncbi:MAG: hypothetical protein AVDCRST_MAG96-286 [uncultured Segetibacter sp.]|uniref:Secretion system C-terminal sorting domain-containing protein n=1 Tax=uncultured Segetibacter sp. TaxID=481133 RepID=A0A6J4RGR2_9BACT|nr:MAG: hypothetical protein AVDCRST_MAG96-286 [uncultured Segetibacter sp.]